MKRVILLSVQRTFYHQTKLVCIFALIIVTMSTLLYVSSHGHASATGSAAVNMKFVGDVMFAGSLRPIIQKNGYAYPYKWVSASLQAADLTAATLETSVTKRGTAQGKQFTFRSDPENLPHLAKAGVDLVTLANNHSLDFGQIGLTDTMRYLDQHKIAHVGAGKNEAAAFRPVIRNLNGIRVAFIGLSRVLPATSWMAGPNRPGLAETYNPARAVRSIANAQKQADLVVVLVHWGKELNDYPVEHQTTLAKRYIDAGADLVIGSHPHTLQGFQNYKGKWIAYSMGNFIFTTSRTAKTWETGILTATCNRKAACQLHLQPVLTKFGQPKPMVGQDATRLLKRISNLSIGAKIGADGKIGLK